MHVGVRFRSPSDAPTSSVLSGDDLNQANKSPGNSVWNVPNKISAARLVLAVFVFVLLETQLYTAALVFFLTAASTDWIDGWYARKFDQVTKLGRVLDPFCDKILICGSYALLAIAMARFEDVFPWWARITGLVAVVIIGRELLVTVLRSMIEGSGGDFSANLAGKLKMWFQCIAVVASLLALILASRDGAPDDRQSLLAGGWIPPWIWWTMVVSIWLSVISTIHSGAVYVKAAAPILFR